MKKMKKGICITLALIMTVSAFTMSAFAYGEKSISADRDTYTYVAMGDSISAGFDTDKTKFTDFAKYLQVLHDSPEYCYPRVLGNMMNLKNDNVYNFAALGMCTKHLNKILAACSGGYPTLEQMNTMVAEIWGMQNYFDNDNQVKEYVDTIKNSDLLTLNIGYNDFYMPVGMNFNLKGNPLGSIVGLFTAGMLMGATVQGMLDGSALMELSKVFSFDTSRISEMKNIDIKKLLTAENIKAVIEQYTAEATYNKCIVAIEDIKNNYPEILDNLCSIKENGDIVVIGLHNPYGIKNYISSIRSAIENGELWVRLGGDTDAFNYLISRAIDYLKGVDTKALLKSLADEIALMEEIESEPVLMSEEDMDEATTVLLEDVILPIMCLTVGEGMEKGICEANEIIKSEAEKRGLTYVDVSNAPGSARIDPHLNATGHKYFAQQIYNEVTPEVTAMVIGSGGTVSNAGTTEYLLGQDAEYVVSANNGYEINKVLVDGKNVTAEGGIIKLSDLNENHSISVSFKSSKTKISDIWSKKNIGYNYFKGFRLFPFLNWFR